MSDLDLHELLDLATDGIESPGLAAPALQSARRRRARRRGAVVAVAASALVVGVVATTHLAGGPSAAPPAAPSRTPSVELTEDAGLEQPRWDPRDVDELPAARDDVAPSLPDVIDPPDTSTGLAEAPVDAAVAAVVEEGQAQLLTSDGSWRSIELEGRYPRAALSPQGTRLVTYVSGDGGGATVHDLSTGESRVLSVPEGHVPTDFMSWRFLDEDVLLFDDGAGGWRVDAATGSATQTLYPSEFTWTADPNGVVVESAETTGPSVLTDWATGRPRRVSMAETGRLSSVRASASSVVGTSYLGRPYAVVVADRATLTPEAVLPVLDHDANYSNWALRVLALADDGTVLLRVAVVGRDADGFRVVAWDPATAELSVVSSVSVPVETDVAFADALVREVPAAEEAATAAPPIDPAVVQPLWDPATVTDLPWDDEPGLPRSLTPPGELSEVADGTPVLAAVDQGDAVALWQASGAWRSLAYPEDPVPADFDGPSPSLSPDGQVAAFAGRTGIWTVDTAGDEWRRVDYPPGFKRAADWGVDLLVDGAGCVMVQQYGSVWRVLLDTGETTLLERSPYDLTAAPDGTSVGFTFDESTSGRMVAEYTRGELVADTDSEVLQSLNRPAASDDRLAAVRGVGSIVPPRDPVEQNGVVVVERGTLVASAYLPIRDPGYGFTDAGSMGMLAWIDSETVLGYVIGDGGIATGVRHLFTWNVDSGELRRVSELPASLRLDVASAPGG